MRCLAPVLAASLSALLPAQTAAEVLGSLTTEQKVGQLFMSWILARQDGQQQNRAQMRRWIEEVGLGGVIVSLGAVEEAAVLVQDLQSHAKVPLLMAGDFEGGVAFRLTGATEMGNQMLVGASGSAALARAMGEVTGREARALGFHWCFAPVLDVNVNPQNPIINVRSFGGDPALVARLGAAFASGVRSQGALPCGKHFPGHGDVATDSHLSMPTVPGDRARLEAVELLPFAVAAREGLESVMSGHLAVPGLGEDPAVPATLSKKILGAVLRDELGFTGLVVTDALDMGGVKGALPPGEVAVRALAAGADVLLMPPDPYAARDAVLAAVRDGRVSMDRLDDAVGRILAMKERQGLLSGGGRVDPGWRSVVGSAVHGRVAVEIARRGVTLVRDPWDLLPLSPGDQRLLVTLMDQEGTATGATFAAGLGVAAAGSRRTPAFAGRELRLHGKSDPDAVAAVTEAVAAARQVVLALHVRVRSYSGQIGLPPALQPVVAALHADQEVVAVSFGNPYLGRELPTGATYLCAYASGEGVEDAVAAALRGDAEITGRLPVAIPGVAQLGGGLSLYSAEPVRGDAAALDLDPALPERIATLLREAVADGAFPGAVCLVARAGRVAAEVAVGREGYEADSPVVTLATRYDLASLTKVCATAPVVLWLAGQGMLSLEDPVQKWVPAFVGQGKQQVTVAHLLTHSSGLPAYERYYRTVQGKDAIVAAAAAEGLLTRPGERMLYSDLGLILLMAVVEKCTGEDFAAFVQRTVWSRLGMTGAAFAPTDGPPLQAAPTESDAARGGMVQGHVHDENAWAMGGVSGHAGMFGRAEDVLRLGLCYLGGGAGVLDRILVSGATAPAGLVPGDVSRGLGWQLPPSGGWAGSTVPRGTFGHTGFTGTSVWCEPQRDLCVVLLTNRVHPTRVNARITAVRRALHDLVLGSAR